MSIVSEPKPINLHFERIQLFMFKIEAVIYFDRRKNLNFLAFEFRR